MKEYFDYFLACLVVMVLLVAIFGGLFAPLILIVHYSSLWWATAYLITIPMSIAALLYMEDVI